MRIITLLCTYHKYEICLWGNWLPRPFAPVFWSSSGPWFSLLHWAWHSNIVVLYIVLTLWLTVTFMEVYGRAPTPYCNNTVYDLEPRPSVLSPLTPIWPLTFIKWKNVSQITRYYLICRLRDTSSTLQSTVSILVEAFKLKQSWNHQSSTLLWELKPFRLIYMF